MGWFKDFFKKLDAKLEEAAKNNSCGCCSAKNTKETDKDSCCKK